MFESRKAARLCVRFEAWVDGRDDVQLRVQRGRRRAPLGSFRSSVRGVARGVPLVALLCAPRLVADPPDPDPDPRTAPPKQMEASLVLQGPSIDGVLDEQVWQDAVFIADFRQREPNEGEPATQRTEVAIVYDGNAVYIGARMYASDPEAIDALMTRRDDAGTADRLIVSFDTYLDRRTAYSFGVTAAGVRLDWYHPEDNQFNRDRTFDPIWDAATRLTEDGWTAEMRIPFAQLRFNGGAEQVWGMNINRYIPSNNEDVFWVYVPKDESGWASRFGELHGIQDIGSPKRIEFLPYVASQATFTSPSLVDAADPFHGATDLDARLGFDFSMGLGSFSTPRTSAPRCFGSPTFAHWSRASKEAAPLPRSARLGCSAS